MNEMNQGVTRTYKQSLSGTELIFSVRAETESSSAKMLRYNHLPSLTPVQLQWIDGVQEYHYETAGLLSMEEWLKEGSLSQKQALDWLRELLSALQRGEDYLLREENFLLDTGSLYLTKDLHLRLCYLDGYGVPAGKQLTELVGIWLDKLDYQTERDVSPLYEIYQKCQEGADYKELQQVLEKIEKGYKEEKEYHSPGFSEITGEGQKPYVAAEEVQLPEEEEREQAVFPRGSLLLYGGAGLVAFVFGYFGGLFSDASGLSLPRIGVALLIFLALGAFVFEGSIRTWWKKRKEEEEFDWGDPPGEIAASAQRESEDRTEILWEKETELLREFPQESKAYLVTREKKTIPLTTLPFVLGSGRDASYRFSAPTVSRRHVSIELEGDQFILKDLHSTNGTWVNGQKVPDGGSMPLEEGDCILMAQDSVVFHKEPQGEGIPAQTVHRNAVGG